MNAKYTTLITLGRRADYQCLIRTEVKEYVYSTLCKDTALNVSSKKTAFDPQIPTTLPISLAEMCKHVEGCHSDNKTAFHSQFEVNSRAFQKLF